MFHLFLRSPTNAFFRGILGNREFKARSAQRDAETDRCRIQAVLEALTTAIDNAEGEQVGLIRRVEEVTARAAVGAGNDSDEYLTRDERDRHHIQQFEKEMASGQRRLHELNISIAHFKFLTTALLERFPDHDGASS